MTPEELQALREKHTPKFLGAYEDGVKCCYECHDNDDYARCALCIDYINNDGPYLCDTIKVLEELEQVERQSAINYELGYEFGYRDANKKWTDKL